MGSTGTINLSPTPKAADLSGHVHHLPCCVKFTGPSDVSHYFKPRPSGFEIDGLAVEESFFRGRKLQGVTVPLPDGYSGSILGKKSTIKDKAKKTAGRGKSRPTSSDSENGWERLAKCGNMTFWNHDSLPSQDDACMRLFHFFAVAKALHEPVTNEDLTSESVARDQNAQR